MTALDDRLAAAAHGPHGPYASLDAAAADSDHVYAAVRAQRATGFGGSALLSQILEGLEVATLRECGVELGPGDIQFAGWLATWEPMFAQIVEGWVERAFAAGQDSILAPIQTMLDDPAEVHRDVTLIRCCASGCVQTELLPVGSTLICPAHGGEHHELRHDHGHDSDLEGVAL